MDKKVAKTVATWLGASFGEMTKLALGTNDPLLTTTLSFVVKRSVEDIAERLLSYREQERIKASCEFMDSGIAERLKEGCQIRTDNFFSRNQLDKSSAGELLEGVLLKSRDSYQEKKIKHLSRIFENTIFNDKISSETANQILSAAQNMSYRKYCLLSFAYKNERNLLHGIHLDNTDYRDIPDNLVFEKQLLFQDFVELQSLGLVRRSDDTLIMESVDVIPSLMYTTEIGLLYTQIMGLDEIADSEMTFLQTMYKNK